MTLIKGSSSGSKGQRRSTGFARFWPVLTAVLGLAGLLAAVGLLAATALANVGGHSETVVGSRQAVAEAPTGSPTQESAVVGGESTTPPPASLLIVEPEAPAQAAAAHVSSASEGTLTPGAPPESAMLENVPMGRQARNLSCELQTASDLAWYYGKAYTWEEIFMLVGYSPEGDPQRGFVGRSLNDLPGNVYPYGYGVYAEPIARALRQIGLPAQAHYGETTSWLRAHVAQGRPVMVWAVGGMRVAEPQEWFTTDGVLVRGVPYEHTYLVVGYDASHVWVQDPWDGKQRSFGWDRFVASWDVLGRMAVVVEPEREN